MKADNSPGLFISSRKEKPDGNKVDLFIFTNNDEKNRQWIGKVDLSDLELERFKSAISKSKIRFSEDHVQGSVVGG